MTDDRAPFREAREHGLRARQETREARAIRKTSASGPTRSAASFCASSQPEAQTLIREIGATP